DRLLVFVRSSPGRSWGSSPQVWGRAWGCPRCAAADARGCLLHGSASEIREPRRHTPNEKRHGGAGPMQTTMTLPTIQIRLARPDDEATLVRLAALDSAPAPHGDVLVALVGGE